MGSICGDDPVQEMGSRPERIVVSVRLRPLNGNEIGRKDVMDWECIDENTIIYRNSVHERSNYPSAYTFDRVFQCECPTKQVYDEAAKRVALSVVSGVNASIFAYGQTSSGKTYTMCGITEFTVEDIYEYIQRHEEREFNLKFSAMEIYNESVRDLLSVDTTPLRLLDDPERGTVVDRLTEETLRDLDHLKELLSICSAQRQIGETALNEASSRSHQILRLSIDSCARVFFGKDRSSTLSASVDFVDLAGSERASQTLSAGTRLKEGCHINRSLLTLGTVIRKLSKGRNGHVPYRDSKLTRILQCSLGGNARTAIICTINPARTHVEQTRNTLSFASCAKEVSTNAQVNVVMSDKALVKQLQRELARLESELKTPGPISAPRESAALLREKDLKIEKLEREIKEMAQQLMLIQSRPKELVHVSVDVQASNQWFQSEFNEPPRIRAPDVEDLVNVDGDDQAFEHWSEFSQPLRIHAPNTVSDDDLTSEGSGLADRHYLDVGLTRFNSSKYSNGGSESNSDDAFLQLPETPEDQFLCDGIPPRFSNSSNKFVEADPEVITQGENITQGTVEGSEDISKEVGCIEMEKSNANRKTESNDFSMEEGEEMFPLSLTENGAETDQVLSSSPPKGEVEWKEAQTEDQALSSSPKKGDRELREVQTEDQAFSSSPQEGDRELREVQTEEQALFSYPREEDSELSEVQNEDHALSSSPREGDRELWEIQTEDQDQALVSSPQEGDRELREVQTEDQALPLCPQKGECELREVQTEEQGLSSSPRKVDGELWEVQTEDQAFSSCPQKGAIELREVQTEDQALSSSPRKGDRELREVQTEDQALYSSPRMVDRELREVQTEDQALSSSPRKGDRELREVQTEDQAPYSSPRMVDRELREVQAEDQAMYSSPRKGDRELTKVQTEDQAWSSSPRKADRDLRKVQTENQALSSSPRKGDRELRKVQTEYGILEKKLRDVQKTIDSLLHPSHDDPSSWSPERDLSRSNSLKLTKSRSCRASTMSSRNSSPSWLQKAEQTETTPSNGHEKDFPGRPKDFQRKFPALNYSFSISRYSSEDSFTSGKSVPTPDSKALNVESPSKDDVAIINYSPKRSKYSREDSFASEQSTYTHESKVHNIRTPSKDDVTNINYGPNRSLCSREDSFTSEASASIHEPQVHNIGTRSKEDIANVNYSPNGQIYSRENSFTSERSTCPHELEVRNIETQSKEDITNNNYSPNRSMYSREDSFTSEHSAFTDESKFHNIETQSKEEIASIHTFVSGQKEVDELQYEKQETDDQVSNVCSEESKDTDVSDLKEMTDLQCEKQAIEDQAQEPIQKTGGFAKAVKDIGLQTDECEKTVKNVGLGTDECEKNVKDVVLETKECEKTVKDIGLETEEFEKNVEDIGLGTDECEKNVKDVGLETNECEKSVKDVGLECDECGKTVEDVGLETDECEKNVRDVGLDPVSHPVESPSRWPMEFERQQREIIELWETCNVSLVHRTYFFLLFKGDPSDGIYLEVERRRLSFLKDRISQGNSNNLIVEGVPGLMPASSTRALRREREMLSKQMQKRLTEEERLNLYSKWGIELNTKQRRVQLSRRLWTDPKDMNHIVESATLVARLVGLLEPGHALKEMFGLSFTPQQVSRKSLSRRSISWKNSKSTLL